MEATRLILERIIFYLHIYLESVEISERRRREFGVKNGIIKLLWRVTLAKRIGLGREGILLTQQRRFSEKFLIKYFL